MNNGNPKSLQLKQFLSHAHTGCYLEISIPLAEPFRMMTECGYLLGEGRTEYMAIRRAYAELEQQYQMENGSTPTSFERFGT